MLKELTTLLFISGDPLSRKNILALLATDDATLTKTLEELKISLTPLGLLVVESTEGISLATGGEQALLVEKFWKEEIKGDLTPSQLQVLTLVAYLGNPTREEISYIRGVQSSQSIRTLTVRGLVVRNGEQCSLSHEALQHLGITKIEDLPDYEMIRSSFREKLKKEDL
jgi:chromosome segregation and condensation protein ScpB